MSGILEQIHEGMAVEDSDGQAIGTVDFLHFGDDDASTQVVEASAASSPAPASNPEMEAGRPFSVIDVFNDMLRGEDMPESLRQRLARQGFLRIAANGLFGADRYVTPDQIARVTGDRVVLGVKKDELVRRRD